MDFPHSPTRTALEAGLLGVPKLDEDPYGSVGVWPDGNTVYTIDTYDQLWLHIYDRELATDLATAPGTGWRKVALQTDGAAHKATYQFTYDFTVNGGAVGSITLTQPNGPIPDDFVIQSAWLDLLTPLTSGGAATAALTSGESANDLVAATTIGGAPWDVANQYAAIPDFATIADWIKTTAARSPALVVATAALTAGKFHLFLEGYVSA